METIYKAIALEELADEDWKTQLAQKYPNIPKGSIVNVLQEDYYNFYGGPWTRVEWKNRQYWIKPDKIKKIVDEMANKSNSLHKLKIFISGPMRGYPKYNFPKFDFIEEQLKHLGVECVNPARISRKFKEADILNSANAYNEMVKQQQEAEKTCNALLLLDGWQHSKGVMLELKTAMDLDMQILLESDLCNMLIDNINKNTQM